MGQSPFWQPCGQPGAASCACNHELGTTGLIYRAWALAGAADCGSLQRFDRIFPQPVALGAKGACACPGRRCLLHSVMLDFLRSWASPFRSGCPHRFEKQACEQTVGRLQALDITDFLSSHLPGNSIEIAVRGPLDHELQPRQRSAAVCCCLLTSRADNSTQRHFLLVVQGTTQSRFQSIFLADDGWPRAQSSYKLLSAKDRSARMGTIMPWCRHIWYRMSDALTSRGEEPSPQSHRQETMRSPSSWL